MYIKYTNFTVCVGEIRWQAGAFVCPKLDKVTDPLGTLIYDGSTESGRIPNRLTDKSQIVGNWDPLIAGVTEFANKNATFVRLGKVVTVRAYISFIGKTVPANNGVITGLPFVPKNLGPGGFIPCSVYRGLVSDVNINVYLDTANGSIVFNRPSNRAAVAFESNADYMILTSYEIA